MKLIVFSLFTGLTQKNSYDNINNCESNKKFKFYPEAQVADLRKEIEKRRTFAIISHPDAGKTTLTEKFLLYGGAINLAD